MLAKILLPPTHPEMLGRLGRNEIESVIGCGGMGVVLRGFDRDLQRAVAIKMILPRLSKNGTAKQRFAREARAVAAVLHPNVIAIHGIEETNGVPWFVMPLILGASLRELVQEKGPLPEKEIVRIGLQIASGLAAAHSQGLVHRDIKPENILIDNQVNRVLITDFGLACRDSEETMTQTGCLAGTLNYMSPEQAQGKNVDARSDLFSLGSLLYYLAAGVVPFQSESPMGALNKISSEVHPDVRSLNPDISATLSGVIDRLLQKQPVNRFQSAVELESFLSEYIAHLHQPTQHQAPAIPKINVVPKIKTKSRFRWNHVGTFAAIVSGIAIGSWLTYLWVTSGAITVPHAMTWEQIKLTYQLDQPEEFERQLDAIGTDILRVERQLEKEQAQGLESDSFNQLANLLDQSLEQLERNLK